MELNSNTTVILGSSGQLGSALCKLLPEARGIDLDTYSLGITEAFPFNDTKVIINAAAYTNVDGAETPEGKVLAWQINATGLQKLIGQVKAINPIIVHVSSDYVFDGSKRGEYLETDLFCPLSVYGSSKAAGDLVISEYDKHYILRTSWLIGVGKNFVRTMLDVARKGINPSVVNDQIGRLTFTEELTNAIVHLLNTSAPFGTYNLTGSGAPVSWADVTSEIYKLAGLNNKVTGITTAEYFKDKPSSAKRPLNSVLNLEKIQQVGFTPKDWQEGLKDYLANLS